MAVSLAEDCLLRLREYVSGLGGKLEGEWRCRAQTRDVGSRAGSIDTWFRAPGGEVYRSKVAVARGLGLLADAQPSAKQQASSKQQSRPSHPRKPKQSSDKGTPCQQGSSRGQHSRSRRRAKMGELTVNDLAELLMSMPESEDMEGRYRGWLAWRDRGNIRNPAIAVALQVLLESCRTVDGETGAGVPALPAPAMAPASAAVPAAAAAAQGPVALPVAMPVRWSPVVAKPGTSGPHVLMSFELPPGSLPRPLPSPPAGRAALRTEQVVAELTCQAGDQERPVTLALRVAQRAANSGPRPRPVAFLTIPVVSTDGCPTNPIAIISPIPPAMPHQRPPAASGQGGAQQQGVGGSEPPASDSNAPPSCAATWQASSRVANNAALVPNGMARPPSAAGPAGCAIPQPGSGSPGEHLAGAAAAERGESMPMVDGPATMEVDGHQSDDSRRGAASGWLLSGMDELVADALLGIHESRPPLQPGGVGPTVVTGSPALRPPRPSSESLRGKSPEEVEAALMERLRRYVSELGKELPSGWTVRASVRKTGVSAGGIDAYYYSPKGKRCKSMVKVAEALGQGGSPQLSKQGSLASSNVPSPAPSLSKHASLSGMEAASGGPPVVTAFSVGLAGGRSGASLLQCPPSPPPSTQPPAFLSPETEQQQQPHPSSVVVFASQYGQQQHRHPVPQHAVREHAEPGVSSLHPDSPQHSQQTEEAAAATRVPAVAEPQRSRSSAELRGQQRSLAPGELLQQEEAVAAAASEPTASELLSQHQHQASSQIDEALPSRIQQPSPTAGVREAVRLSAPSSGSALAPASLPQSQQGLPPLQLCDVQLALAAVRQEKMQHEALLPSHLEPLRSALQQQFVGRRGQLLSGRKRHWAAAVAVGGPGGEGGSDSDESDSEDKRNGSGGETNGPSSNTDRANSEAGSLPDATPEEGEASLPGGANTASHQNGRGADGGRSKRARNGTEKGRQQSQSGRSQNGAGGHSGNGKSGGGGSASFGGGGGGRKGGGGGGDKKGGGSRKDGEDGEKEGKGSRKRKRAKKGEAALNQPSKVVNQYDRMLNRLRGQLSRLRQEQALVEAYAADGWRGASREKVKPVAEIKRAKEQIKRCKEVIRECVKYCDDAEGDRPIPSELFDENGELDLDHIFCSKCKLNHASDDNDIILCDGPCNRAYHVQCLVPPVDPETLPEDEGWLCPACDRKVDMIDLINDEFGTEYELETPWEQILDPSTIPKSPHANGPGSPRAAVDLGRLEGLLEGADLPSEDEEDEDYVESGSDEEEEGGGAGGSGSGDSSKSDDSSNDSADSEGNSLASEDLAGKIEDVEVEQAMTVRTSSKHGGQEEEGGEDEGPAHNSGSGEADPSLILQHKRRRVAVDYRSLNAEMFGDFEVDEGEFDEGEDEVWSPRNQKGKGKLAWGDDDGADD